LRSRNECAWSGNASRTCQLADHFSTGRHWPAPDPATFAELAKRRWIDVILRLHFLIEAFESKAKRRSSSGSTTALGHDSDSFKVTAGKKSVAASMSGEPVDYCGQRAIFQRRKKDAGNSFAPAALESLAKTQGAK